MEMTYRGNPFEKRTQNVVILVIMEMTYRLKERMKDLRML